MAESPTMKLLKKNKKTPEAAAPVEEAPTPEVVEEAPVEKPAKPAKVAKVVEAAPAAKEAEPLPATKEKVAKKGSVEILGPDLIATVCKEVENLKADDAIKLAHTLLEDVEFNSFKLGGVLAAIQTHGHWQGHGYDTFKDFIEAEFGIHYRKAMYLCQIYTELVNSGVPWEKVKGIGWTKLKEIAHLMNPENVDDWVTKANELSTLNLIQHAKAVKDAALAGEIDGDGTAAEGVPELTKASLVTPITFKVHADQKETIREAIEKKRIEINTEYDNFALESICLGYLAGTSGKPKKAKEPTLAEIIKGKPIEEVIAVLEAEYPTADITIAM